MEEQELIKRGYVVDLTNGLVYNPTKKIKLSTICTDHPDTGKGLFLDAVFVTINGVDIILDSYKLDLLESILSK